LNPAHITNVDEDVDADIMLCFNYNSTVTTHDYRRIMHYCTTYDQTRYATVINPLLKPLYADNL